jgi:transmembrane sensor
MTNLLAFPDAKKAREEASIWMARLDRGLTDEERAELEQWLREPVNRKALLEMGQVWQGLDVLAALAELFPRDRHSTAHRRRGRGFSTWMLAAASATGLLLVAIGLFAVLKPVQRTHSPAVLQARNAHSPSRETHATAVGESRSVPLSDGSSMVLNTHTTVVVHFSADTRDVYLQQGEASFTVARDPQRPFNLHAGNRVLQAVGTAFNVRIVSDTQVELTVTEGKVRVLPRLATVNGARLAAGADSAQQALMATTVTAREVAIVEPASEEVRPVASSEIDQRLAWQHGMLIFRGEPLETVLAEMDRYTRTEFVLLDDELRGVRVGGYFRAGDIDGLLIALRENFQIDSYRDGSHRIVLSPAPR